MTIIISKPDGLIKIKEAGIAKEIDLQEYIHNNPDIIPIDEIDSEKSFLYIAREFKTSNGGSIDLLAIDNDGEVYIIETKLYKNKDKRLVIAQVLEYGASIWSQYSNNPNEFLDDLISNTRSDNILEDEEIKDSIKANIKDGNINFIILMDKIPPQLKDIILFLNNKSSFNILAVELAYYTYDELDIFIPRLFGSEVKEYKGSESRKKWDEQSFFSDAKNRLSNEQYEAIKRMYELSKEIADEITWGTGSARGSFNVKFYKVGPRSLYSVYSDGTLTLNFGWLDAYKDEFRNKLRSIERINNRIPPNYYEKTSKIPIEEWRPFIEDFIGVVKSLIKD